MTGVIDDGDQGGDQDALHSSPVRRILHRTMGGLKLPVSDQEVNR
jgi:hypothetical protein